MIVCDNDMVAIEKMRFWATQAREPFIHYEHKEYGYNYRMSNICACIGRGQLMFLEQKISLRRHIHKRYKEAMDEIPAHIKLHGEKHSANCWLNLLVLDTEDVTPAEVVTRLQNADIESRPAWKPMHMQPLFKGAIAFAHNEDGRFVCEDIFNHALCLPSGDGMQVEQQEFVISIKESDICLDGFKDPELRIDRYDPYVPRELLEQVYRANALDVGGLRDAWAESLEGLMHK